MCCYSRTRFLLAVAFALKIAFGYPQDVGKQTAKDTAKSGQFQEIDVFLGEQQEKTISEENKNKNAAEDTNYSHEKRREAPPFIPIIRFNKEQGTDGGYRTTWETGNNIFAEETGILKHFGAEHEHPQAVISHGSYSYTSPEGKLITVQYTADELGFRAFGEHLPTPPPIPEEIQRGLDVIYKGIKEKEKHELIEADRHHLHVEEPRQHSPVAFNLQESFRHPVEDHRAEQFRHIENHRLEEEIRRERERALELERERDFERERDREREKELERERERNREIEFELERERERERERFGGGGRSRGGETRNNNRSTNGNSNNRSRNENGNRNLRNRNNRNENRGNRNQSRGNNQNENRSARSEEGHGAGSQENRSINFRNAENIEEIEFRDGVKGF